MKHTPSSNENNTPPTGAPKAAATPSHKHTFKMNVTISNKKKTLMSTNTPAAAPAETKSRLSLSLRKALKMPNFRRNGMVSAFFCHKHFEKFQI